MTRALLRVLLLICSLCLSLSAQATLRAIVVAGLGGEAEYEQQFRQQATALSEAVAKLDDEAHVMLLIGEQAQLSALRRELQSLANKSQPGDQLLLMLVGHGSFDGEEYRFNVPGPDLTATELSAMLNRINVSEQIIVIASSASGGALARLKQPGRIVITATKSGTERNASRFAEQWVRALTTSEADTDKDEWVTLKEAFEFAERKVADGYKADAALATEHARLQDDSGRAERIPVARLGKARAMPTDPELRSLFAERLRIEQQVDAVKQRKAAPEKIAAATADSAATGTPKADATPTVNLPPLSEEQYYDEIEKVLIALAKTQQQIDARQAVVEKASGDATNGRPRT